MLSPLEEVEDLCSALSTPSTLLVLWIKYQEMQGSVLYDFTLLWDERIACSTFLGPFEAKA